MNGRRVLSRFARFRVRTLMGLVGLVGLSLCVWETAFDPARRWVRTIRDDDAGGRRWEAVSQALQGKVPGVDDTAAVAALTAALDDPSYRIRENAAAALAAFGSRVEQAVPALGKALWRETDSYVRMAESGALFSILCKTHHADEATTASLISALNDRNRHVRIHSAAALTEIGQSDVAMPELIDCLSQPDALTRMYAIWALKKAGPKARDALPGLIALVNEPDEQGQQGMKFRRVEAAELLHDLGATELAMRVLRQYAEDADGSVRQEAVKALRAINPDELRKHE